MNKSLANILFVIILGAFSVSAFHGIKNQGLLYHDVGTYLLEAKFLNEGLSIVRSPVTGSHNSASDWKDIKHGTSGTPLRMGKPALSAILCLAGYLAGFSDSVAAQVTSLCAVFVLCLTFLIALRISNPLCAVFAAALLACSTFHMLYARSGLADPLASVFFLTGILLYLHGGIQRVRFWTFALGLALGLAFCTNQWRMAYMPGILLFLDWSRAWRAGQGWSTWKKRTGFFLLGFLTPIFVFQLPYTIARWKVGPLPFPDYWTQLVEKFGSSEGLTWFGDIGAMTTIFWKVEGPFFSLLIALAWGLLLLRWIREKCFNDLLIVLLSLVPFLYFSSMQMNGETLPRTVSSIVPIACIGAGEVIQMGFARVSNAFGFLKKRQAMAGTILAILLVGLMLPRATRTGITSSGYAEASSYLNATAKKPFFILGMEPVWRFYLGRAAYKPYSRPPALKDMVESGRSNGVDLVLVDFTTIHSKYGMSYTADLVKSQEPLAIFPNPLGRSFPHLLDAYGLYGAERIAADETCDKIYIFSLKDIAEKEL